MDVKRMIRTSGKPVGKNDIEGQPVCEVLCQGCRKKIRSDSDLRRVGYVKTKSGRDLFFHTDCMSEVWKQGVF
ncbi:MAG: hypothetical protein HFI66_04795 [Lachnospiraceae bacterium]|nr:hypothetical protein [Lachnospiraceae bacterium]